MADKSKMSVADILAAARKADGQGASPVAKSPAPADGAPTDSAPAAEQSAPRKAAAAAPKPATAGGKPSVADILAMARGAKGGAPPAAPKPAAKESPKPAAKPAAAKAAPKQAAAAAPVETQSILAAARKGAKPGPMTKADAAAKGVAIAAAPKKAAAKETIVVPPMPVKPDYAKPAAQRTDVDIVTRRAVLFGLSALAVGFTALAASLAMWTLGTVRFMFPNVLRLPPSKFKVGFPDQISMGQVEEKYKAGFGVWIVKTEYNGQPELFALKSVCTHLGCTPNWLEAEQKFKCPCHGSGFYKDGINFEGPAPRPLERYAIAIGNDGQVEVDKSRTFHEEMGQWSDPASFIPA